MIQQRSLVLDVVTCGPCLDLISQSLQLLDFTFEVIFELLLLGDVIRLFNLFVDGFEFSNALGHFLEALVDFLL